MLMIVLVYRVNRFNAVLCYKSNKKGQPIRKPFFCSNDYTGDVQACVKIGN